MRRVQQRMKKITNKHINNFLEEHGCLPIYENGNECWYESTPLFVSLLDRYHIEYICIPNKL